VNPYELAWTRLQPIITELIDSLPDEDGWRETAQLKVEAVRALVQGAQIGGPRDPWREGYIRLRRAVADALDGMGPGYDHMDNLAAAVGFADELVELLGGDPEEANPYDDGGDQ
jgi:hypothetical protein